MDLHDFPHEVGMSQGQEYQAPDSLLEFHPGTAKNEKESSRFPSFGGLYDESKGARKKNGLVKSWNFSVQDWMV